ncbi:hypothetical protein HKD37_02G004743 [Glycine soja]
MEIGFLEHVLALELGLHFVSNFGFHDHLMGLEKLFHVLGNMSPKFGSSKSTCLRCSTWMVPYLFEFEREDNSSMEFKFF